MYDLDMPKTFPSNVGSQLSVIVTTNRNKS